jgi:hypothetical protein
VDNKRATHLSQTLLMLVTLTGSAAASYNTAPTVSFVDNTANCTSGGFTCFTPLAGSYVQIAAAADGTVIGRDSSGYLWMLPPSTTSGVSAAIKMTSLGGGNQYVAVQDSGHIFALRADPLCSSGYYRVFLSTNAQTWTPWYGCGTRISASSDGAVLVSTPYGGGTIWTVQPGSDSELSGTGWAEVAALNNTTAYAIGPVVSGNNVYQLDLVHGTQTLLSGWLSKIAADTLSNVIWGIGGGGIVYSRDMKSSNS